MDKHGIKIVDCKAFNSPVIYLELNLLFDNNTNMIDVTKEIGLDPISFKNKSEQMKSPFKDDNIEGYWSIKTEKFDTYYLEEVSKSIVEIVKPFLERIKTTLQKHNGTADFLIVTEFYPLDTPALNFNREFLNVVSFLSATIQIDMYVND